jgi:hypothetical protein
MEMAVYMCTSLRALGSQRHRERERENFRYIRAVTREPILEANT